MKKIVFVFIFAAIGIFANAQTVPLALRMDLVTWVKLEPKSYLAGGKIGTLNVEVRNYDVYQTGSGQYYINFTNSRLTTSRKYLGYKIEGTQEYQGNTIFFSVDTTKSWIWTVDRYGQIFKMDLPDFFATDLKKDSIP
jgi:hypothetical protein